MLLEGISSILCNFVLFKILYECKKKIPNLITTILENERTSNYVRYVNGTCLERHESQDQSEIPAQGMTELWAARGGWKIRFLRAMQA